jgi:hypothetical protein
MLAAIQIAEIFQLASGQPAESKATTPQIPTAKNLMSFVKMNIRPLF